jgi:hypothetical protein
MSMEQDQQAGTGPLERPVRRLDDGLPADAVRFAGAPAPRIRVYRMDDNEWWAGESLAACVAEGRRQCGADCYPDSDEQHELSDDELQRLIFIDESDGAEPPVKRTFAEQLAREVAEGGAFPRPFAAEDW